MSTFFNYVGMNIQKTESACMKWLWYIEQIELSVIAMPKCYIIEVIISHMVTMYGYLIMLKTITKACH